MTPPEATALTGVIAEFRDTYPLAFRYLRQEIRAAAFVQAAETLATMGNKPGSRQMMDLARIVAAGGVLLSQGHPDAVDPRGGVMSCDLHEDCVCDVHLECETCLDTGEVEVHFFGYQADVPCPDCPAGDSRD